MRYLRIGSGPPPTELITYILCHEIYHCRPSELMEERVVDVWPHLTCHSKVNQWRDKIKSPTGAGKKPIARSGRK